MDPEIERLRRLRVSALKLRAVAKKLASNRHAQDTTLLSQGRCAAWRVARAVTGRLREHPNVRFHQDAGVAVHVKNSLIAGAASLTATSRHHVMKSFTARLREVLRELEDTRALTTQPDLSNLFGRSQQEMRSLVASVQCDGQPHTVLAADRTATAGGRDWPFLAI